DKKADAALRAACEGSNQFACDVERYKAQQAAKTYSNLGYQNPKEQQAGYQQIEALLNATSEEGRAAQKLYEAKVNFLVEYWGFSKEGAQAALGRLEGTKLFANGVAGAYALNKLGMEGDIAAKPVKPVKPTTAPREPSPVDGEMVGQDRPVAPLQGGGAKPGVAGSEKEIDKVEVTRTSTSGAESATTAQKLKDELAAKMTKPIVSDSKLEQLMNDLYRDGAKIGTGSTADAVRYEMSTGKQVGGKTHTQKAKDYSSALEIWLEKTPNASSNDRSAAENVLRDLQNALNGK
ncbi:hypothetical protein, partial [Chitiniphilus shinanonensis]|uniref:hypothetical protein n=1 Tax=Chitiniphilus shinanonensis TaxID=553088 RepID=UPI001B7FD3FD